MFGPRRNFQLQGFAGRAATMALRDATEAGGHLRGLAGRGGFRGAGLVERPRKRVVLDSHRAGAPRGCLEGAITGAFWVQKGYTKGFLRCETMFFVTFGVLGGGGDPEDVQVKKRVDNPLAGLHPAPLRSEAATKTGPTRGRLRTRGSALPISLNVAKIIKTCSTYWGSFRLRVA